MGVFTGVTLLDRLADAVLVGVALTDAVLLCVAVCDWDAEFEFVIEAELEPELVAVAVAVVLAVAVEDRDALTVAEGVALSEMRPPSLQGGATLALMPSDA